MVDIGCWMEELAEKLSKRFGSRLRRWSAAVMAEAADWRS